MKKYLLSIVLMLAFGGSVMAQTQTNTINFNKIPDMTFPCQLESNQIDAPPIVFNTPRDLSLYCSQKAQANISTSQNCFIAGVSLTAVGSILYSIGYSRDEEGLTVGGLLLMLGGSVCEIVSVADLLGHWKWEYRRKQVDLYLTPGGAALKF